MGYSPIYTHIAVWDLVDDHFSLPVFLQQISVFLVEWTRVGQEASGKEYITHKPEVRRGKQMQSHLSGFKIPHK